MRVRGTAPAVLAGHRLGGHSLLRGPVAAAIVWGLVFSTVLTLLIVPLLYRLSMTDSRLRR